MFSSGTRLAQTQGSSWEGYTLKLAQQNLTRSSLTPVSFMYVMKQKTSTEEDHVCLNFQDETATYFFLQQLPVKRDNHMQRYS